MPIIIHTHETERPLIGKSHWWGAPDLPADTPFPYVTLDNGTPEPLTFVCQIRCEDIAAHDPDGRVFKILIILMSNLSPKYPPN